MCVFRTCAFNSDNIDSFRLPYQHFISIASIKKLFKLEQPYLAYPSILPLATFPKSGTFIEYCKVTK